MNDLLINRKTAVAVTTVVVVIAIFLGTYKTINNMNKDVLEYYYHAQYPLDRDINDKIGYVSNLITIAGKYLTDGETSKLETLLRDYADETSLKDKSKLSGQVDIECTNIKIILEKKDMKDSDKNALNSVIVNLASIDDVILRNDYNMKVEELHKKLDNFPSNIFAKIMFIDLAEYYGMD